MPQSVRRRAEEARDVSQRQPPPLYDWPKLNQKQASWADRVYGTTPGARTGPWSSRRRAGRGRGPGHARGLEGTGGARRGAAARGRRNLRWVGKLREQPEGASREADSPSP